MNIDLTVLCLAKRTLLGAALPLVTLVAAIGTGEFSRAAEPEAKVAEYQENWGQAGAGPERLGQQLRSHRVRLEGDVLKGQIFAWSSAGNETRPVQKASVHLLQFGQITHRVLLNDSGTFDIEGVKPGVYGVVVAGPEGFLADTAQFVSDEAARVGYARRFSAVIRPVLFQVEQKRLDIDSLAVPPTSFRVLKRLFTNYVPREAPELVKLVEPSGPEDAPDDAAAAPPPSFPDQNAYPASTVRQHAVHLLPGGRLLGRARRLHRESGRPLRIHRTTVFMIRDNEVVAASPIDELGVFTFEGLRPGVHSVVATGPEGFAAFSVMVEPPMPGAIGNTERNGRGNRFHLAAQQQPPDLPIDLAMVGPENFSPLWDIASREMGWQPLGASFTGQPGTPGGGLFGLPAPGTAPPGKNAVVGGVADGGPGGMFSAFGGVAGGGGGGGGGGSAANGSEEDSATSFQP